MSTVQNSLSASTSTSRAERNCRNRRNDLSLLSHARWTVPLHLALGFALVWIIRHAPDLLGPTLIWLHAGFLILLLSTIRWWWKQWGELAFLLLLNHAATFAVIFCLPQ